MKCEVCRKGVVDGVNLFRVSEKGEPIRWRCWDDLSEEQREKHKENKRGLDRGNL